MIVTPKEAELRLSSSSNLINKLKSITTRDSKTSMELFTKKEVEEIKDVEQTLDELIEDADSKIKINLAHDESLDALVETAKKIRLNINSIDNPSKLADIASKLIRVVGTIRSERNEANKRGNVNQFHLHFYTPEINKVEDYEVIDVN